MSEALSLLLAPIETMALELEPIKTQALVCVLEELQDSEPQEREHIARARELYAWLLRLIDKQDMSDYVEPPGIGIAWLWKLPDEHPFQKAALKHDAAYDLMRAGASPFATSEEPDMEFFRDCLRAAIEQPTLRKIEFYIFEAELFYRLVRAWGRLRWQPPLEGSR